MYNAETPQSNRRLKINKLITQETGTYNPMYLRPFEANVSQNQLQTIHDRLDSVSAGANITPAVFSGIASGILHQSATPESMLTIPYGWAERRIRFFMEVEIELSMGNCEIHYMQGYTDVLGITHTGAVDPNMNFIINSYMVVSRNMQVLPGIGTTYVDRIKDTNQLVNGQVIGNNSGTTLYALRPQDVFTGMQGNYWMNSKLEDPSRLIDLRSRFKSNSISSNRTNNLSSDYLAKTFDSFVTANQLSNYGESDKSILEQAKTLSFRTEGSASENTFLRTLSAVKGYNNSYETFTIGDLEKIDPNIRYVFKHISLSNTAKAQLHNQGSTSYWHGTDRETLTASILSNAIPALMMSSMFSKLAFTSTNADFTGAINTVFLDSVLLTQTDPTANYALFKRRFETDVMFDITNGGQDVYALTAVCDLFGETRLSISINGGPMIDYTTPSFCDSVSVPVVTSNSDSYYKLAHDFEVMFNEIKTDSLSTGRSINMSI